MAAGHGHGHGGRPAGGHQPGGHSAAGRHVRPLLAALCLLGVVMVVEAVAGFWAGSLALLSDAGHVFTDVLGLGLALAAILTARRGPAAGRTFGLYRLEVLAALANAVLLAGVAGWVLVESARRFVDPPAVDAVPMLAAATAGLAANVAAFGLLRAGSQESLTVRGAYLEVLSDTLGSAGVIAAALVVATTGWRYADPLVAVVVGVALLPRTWRLAHQALRILVQAAPETADPAEVRAQLAALDGVLDVHDVHVWTLTSGMDVLSAHLSVADERQVAGVLAAAQTRLRDGYGIAHATLQVEPVNTGQRCSDIGW